MISPLLDYGHKRMGFDHPHHSCPIRFKRCIAVQYRISYEIQGLRLAYPEQGQA